MSKHVANDDDLDIRVRWRQAGGHVYCRVFCNGKAGDLTFSEREWPAVKFRLEMIATVTPEG